VKLRDDKNYPCLRLSIEEAFPTLKIVRRIKKDQSLYFGPYPSATSLKETLRLIRRLFPVRTCLDAKFTRRLRPCINYEMGRCVGPCCEKIDSTQYKEIIHQVRMFLEGKNKNLIERLKKRMEEESEQLHFERAANIRDQTRRVEEVIEKQKMVSRDFLDQDVMGFHRQDHTVIIYSLFVRAGKLLGGKGFHFPSTGLPDEEVLSSFLHQYYREGKFIPEQVLIPKAIPEKNILEQWLTEQRGKRVRILIPQKGDKKNLLQMACENARKFLTAETKLQKDKEKFLGELKEKLHLRRVPQRIEAFDISNLQGRYAVGSMVSFVNGKPDKDRYRHFRIKTIEGVNDYGMMYEILLRRYQRAVEEGLLPDLVLLDGGRGHLNIAQEVFKELQIKGIDLISLAKERGAERRESSRVQKTGEKVFHPQIKEPLFFTKQSFVLHFLDQIRDEAHRFAITYHKKMRRQEGLKSEMEEIPGIGNMRKRALLKYFGSVEKIREATIDQLTQVPKMDLKSARAVYHYFHPNQK
jgi:excinuclease ABC subunit C